MEQNTIVKHYAGSLAYGTNLPTSDIDFRGIFVADPINIRTPFFKVGEATDTSEEDTKFYELSKFVELCVACNPNVVETLWVDMQDVTFTTPAYQYLRSRRLDFLSSKIAFTTSGYALAQLKRIKGHNKWINNPQPVEPPRQIDFLSMVQYFGNDKMLKLDITKWNENHRFVPYGRNVFGVYKAEGYKLYSEDYTLNVVVDENLDRNELSVPLFIVKFNKEEYNNTKDTWGKYWTWKKNRNEARGDLEEKFGYDTKHAMHLVRLLRMGVEALRDCELIVRRPDAEELLDIRNGAWTYDEVVAYAEKMDREVREVWYKKTKLPKKPNLKKAATILMEVQDMVWEQNNV